MAHRIWTPLLAAALCVAAVSMPAAAQRLPVGDMVEDYARVLQVAGAEDAATSFVSRPHAVCSAEGAAHPWSKRIACPAVPAWRGLYAGVVNPSATLYSNSSRPFGQNDGAVWQGRGRTTSITTGGTAGYRFLSVMLRPNVVHVLNQDYALSRLPVRDGQPIYAYPLRTDIDWPQRFGEESLTEVYFDDSYVEVAQWSLAAGVSTENLWWGPAMRNAILMSNNAAGIPHVYLRSSERIASPIGSFEGRWIWGRLSHSEYFVDASYSPDRQIRGSEENARFFTAITLNWNPRWIPGLYFGMAESMMLHYSVERRFFRDYFGVINPPFLEARTQRPNGTDDKMISFFGRWVHPASGVEVYGEWARGDHTSDFRDAFVEPDHARAWTFGLQKVFRRSDRVWTRVMLETTNLEAPRQSGFRLNRGTYFYAHESIKQGYTHDGQIIGAGIGPGSSSQYLQIDVFAPFGKVGIHGLRWVHDNDRYYLLYLGDRRRAWWEHEVELGGGASFLAFLGNFEIGGSATWTRLLNKDYIFKNDESNLNLQFAVRYDLMGVR